jgi:hypothetical protein
MFTRAERDFIHAQMCARKDYFKKDMLFWAKEEDTKEVLRCANAISFIDEINRKLLSINIGGR